MERPGNGGGRDLERPNPWIWQFGPGSYPAGGTTRTGTFARTASSVSGLSEKGTNLGGGALVLPYSPKNLATRSSRVLYRLGQEL